MVSTRSNTEQQSDTPRRKKTKATPLKSVKSPDIQQSRKRVAGGEDEESSFSSASTTSSRQPGLDPFIQKAVAEVIESNGGIAKFKAKGEHTLSRLLDEDLDTFGKRGDKRRVHISKYVNRWAGDPTKYESKVLNRWQIVSSKHRKKQLSSKIPSDDSLSVSSAESSTAVKNKKSSKSVAKSKAKGKQSRETIKDKEESTTSIC